MKEKNKYIVTTNLKSIKEIEVLSRRLGENLFNLIENFEEDLNTLSEYKLNHKKKEKIK